MKNQPTKRNLKKVVYVSKENLQEILQACDVEKEPGNLYVTKEPSVLYAAKEPGVLYATKDPGVLYATKNPEIARILLQKKYPVLGIISENALESEGDDSDLAASFLGIDYLAEEDALSDEEYLEQIYCRLTGTPFTVLETERLLLRETIEEDVDTFYELYKDPEITAYMEDLFADKNEELKYTRDYRKYVYAFYGFGIWTVLLKETGEIIGRVGIEIGQECEVPQLGYVIGKKWQGQGLAKEACIACITYGFEELEYEEIEAVSDVRNAPSVGLLKKLGFAEKEQDDRKLESNESVFFMSREMQKEE